MTYDDDYFPADDDDFLADDDDDFPADFDLRINPNITPSFKKGYFVILLKDSRDSEYPEGNPRFLTKGKLFKIESCALSEYILSPPKFNSEGEFIEGRKPLHSRNDIEWCIVDFETDFTSGAMVKADNCRLATKEDFKNVKVT